MHAKRAFRNLILLGLVVLLASGGMHVSQAAARRLARQKAQTSPIHPTFELLDESGENVLTSGKPLSTMRTCGQCHDTDFIAGHSYHADLGLSDFTQPGRTGSGRPWDASPGAFGKWNPLLYRYLSLAGDEKLDLGTADWIRLFGERHIGGGPAVLSREGQPLEDLPPRSDDPETSAHDPLTGEVIPWDWRKSGSVEMNCFLCHLERPNNAARLQALDMGQFRLASTATLFGSGLVAENAGNLVWNHEAFDQNGQLKREYVTIQDPTNENCAQCHGVVQTGLEVPLVLEACTWETATTGQVISPQRISASGMNIANKEKYNQPWDVHAERQLKCTDCHYSLNNPSYYQEAEESRPDHLIYDPRRLEIGEYLQRPSHEFARGQSAQYTVAPELKGTMRRCESCHAASERHANWLPYTERHLEVLACEACHIPRMYAPAIEYYDWTVLKMNGQPVNTCRGIELTSSQALVASTQADYIPITVTNLVTGYAPVLMMRQDVTGDTALAPYNLVTAWYWVYDDANGNTRPVRLEDLQAAWFSQNDYAPEILATFDDDGDGKLAQDELILNSDEKRSLIASRLESLGLRNPRIQGEIQPYSISHSVGASETAIGECQTCHSAESRLTQPIKLADYLPGEVLPEFVGDANTKTTGSLFLDKGALYYKPAPSQDGLYIFGRDRVLWVDWLGALAFLGVLGGVVTHGGLRFYTSLRQPRHKVEVKSVYMYSVYERFWHWLQTIVIVLLLFTGLIIHRPDMFGIFSFRYVVVVHNVMAALLVLNAGLSLFYHLASGEIRQYLPHPYGFFDQAILQLKFYLRDIFKGAPHPFEKTPQKKLNPLQQATYFAILNLLLPLQIVTGALMWGVQRWPEVASKLGGLPFLAPFHSLIAWLFAAFIVAHVYLTTTGHAPLAGIRAMMYGWDEIEDQSSDPEEEGYDYSDESKDEGSEH